MTQGELVKAIEDLGATSVKVTEDGELAAVEFMAQNRVRRCAVRAPTMNSACGLLLEFAQDGFATNWNRWA